MAQLIWTESALSDLNDIAEYIALENPTAAKALVRRVFSNIQRLEEHPSSGKYPAQLEGKRYRELVPGPCRIFYRYTQSKVVILYAMRSERQLRNFLIQEAEDGSS
ncbi:MAG: type II toxin-antitoxin system RelE/ParE family toxin [Proteobacteria bacterium]|nr:type II toxin-antitoxin system RelE/ParE family toxin [Pseudomonadota bacterium]